MPGGHRDTSFSLESLEQRLFDLHCLRKRGERNTAALAVSS
jgi:hypothetical protein